MERTAHPAWPPMHIQRVESSLSARTISLARREEGATRVLVLLSDGSATLESGSNEHMLIAPMLFWLAQPRQCRLRLRAGSTGQIAEIPDDTLARAVGDFAESAALMFMVDRDLGLSLGEPDGAMARISDGLGAVLEELGKPQSGLAMVIVAHLRIILVQMMRSAGLDEAIGHGRGEDAHLLQRFRQLVEGHFREHWAVARYAEALGITHDRLHAICTRQLGRAPKALIAERLAREAAMALERSSLSIEQLSNALGFRDPAHFSHFHKRMTGLAPGRFRKMMGAATPDEEAFSLPNFADWP